MSEQVEKMSLPGTEMKTVKVVMEDGTIKHVEMPKRKPGRPVNPDSERQQKLAAGGGVKHGKQGRPVNPNSERQLKLAELKKRREELAEKGIEVGRGRPIDPDSDRQKRLRELEAKGTTGERGRPVNPDSERQKQLRKKLAAEQNAPTID